MLICMPFLFLNVYCRLVYDVCQGIRKSEASDTLELESKAVVKHIGAGTQTQVFFKTVCGFISNKH